MKSFTFILKVSFLLFFYPCHAQVPVSQISGLLEVFHPEDSSSMFIGRLSGQSYATTNAGNTVLGNLAGVNLTTGAGNTFVGNSAGNLNSTGRNNSFFGRSAGQTTNTGTDNSFFGSFAGSVNTTGHHNSFIGQGAGILNSAGQTNTFVGAGAGSENRTGSGNTYLGYESGQSNLIGGANTLIGLRAGRFITGSNNVCIGFQAGPPEGGGNVANRLYIDNSTTNTPLILGDFGSNVLIINGTFRVNTGKIFAPNIANIGDHKNMQFNSTTGEIGWDNSSRRYKINITTLHDDWKKIFQTRPVKYSRPASPDYWEYGYIAEEMDSIGLSNLVGYDDQGIPDDVKYDRMVIYLTELVKGQENRIQILEKANHYLRYEGQVNAQELSKLRNEINGILSEISYGRNFGHKTEDTKAK